MAPDRTPGDGEEESWTGSGTVLVADDEEFVRRPAAGMLEHIGFTVRTAVDGLEAVEAVAADARGHAEGERAITCVILDLTMPRMDGVEAFRRIKQIRPGLPVILSSGYSEKQVSDQLGGELPAGFIQKPYTLERLTAAMRRLSGNGPGGGPDPA